MTRSRSIASRATSMAVVAPMLMSVPSRSLSIVEAIPITAAPPACSACAPACEPLPPMTISAVIAFVRSDASARSHPIRRLQRLITRGAQHRPAVLDDAAHVPAADGHGISLRPVRGSHLGCHSTLKPRPIALRTTARIAAFMPGASPPLVNTANRFTPGPPSTSPQRILAAPPFTRHT